MAQEFIDVLKVAFDSGDVTAADHEALKRAIRYLSYLKVPSNGRAAITDCLALTGAYAVGNQTFPFWTDRELNQLSGAGAKGTGAREVYCFIRGDALSSSHVPFRAISTLASDKDRVALFEATWNSWGHPHFLLWVADLDEHQGDGPKRATLAEILMGLGLYSFGVVQPSDWLIGCRFEVSDRVKPSWIDSQLNFYFDGRVDAPEHGLTRCLKTGRKRFPEWVARKGGLKLLDVQAMQVPDQIDLGDPSNDFWQSLRTEVEDARLKAV